MNACDCDRAAAEWRHLLPGQRRAIIEHAERQIEGLRRCWDMVSAERALYAESDIAAWQAALALLEGAA